MNVTYLLGAGASAKCVPVVNKLMDEISGLETKIVDLIRTEYDIGPLSDDFWTKDIGNRTLYRNFFKDLKWLREQSANHETVDTLARRLYHTEGENSLKLNRLKQTLSTALTIFQCSNPLKSNDKQYPDKRYDTFLSTILKKQNGVLKIPDNIKILTWNYDMQLELAATNYFNTDKVDQLQHHLNAMPSVYYHKNSPLPTIVRLNGVAGMFNLSQDKISNLYRDRNLTDWTQMFDTIKFTYEPHSSIDFNTQFSFGWENDSIAQFALESAKKIATQTDIMVIIGYSLPTFNRTIDGQIFNAFINSGGKSKIFYIQNLIDNSEDLVEYFNINRQFIKYRNDCSSFFLPPVIEI